MIFVSRVCIFLCACGKNRSNYSLRYLFHSILEENWGMISREDNNISDVSVFVSMCEINILFSLSSLFSLIIIF